jgi:hypothetical protein
VHEIGVLHGVLHDVPLITCYVRAEATTVVATRGEVWTPKSCRSLASKFVLIRGFGVSLKSGVHGRDSQSYACWL